MSRMKLLLGLSKETCIDNGELDKTYRLVVECLAKGLQIERTSIWFYNSGESSIVCADLYQAKENCHSAGSELFKKDYPNYFRFLTEERTLSATHASDHPATFEFDEVYLKPLNIVSMLDAPIRVNGKMIGLICNESIGKVKEWNLDDEIFVGNVCDIISRAIQANERMKALRELETLNLNLETLIFVRTQELEDQRARSINASKMASLGEMAGSIAHEINNPLAIILSTIKLVKNMKATSKLTPERLEESLTDIEETSFRIEKIVRGLRFFARDANNDYFQEENLLKIVEDTMTLCHERLRIEECKVTIEIPEDIRIFCSSVGLSQAILNLISNAIDALDKRPEKWIKINCAVKIDTIYLSITDSGAGIPQDIREKIMLPFFTTKPIGKGTGLGLPIIKGIIEQHKGEFLLDMSNANTSFIIVLPVAA